MRTDIYENLSMTGNVVITLLNGDIPFRRVVQHNSATVNLCKYLRDAIVGTNITARRPGILTVCYKDNSDNLVDWNNGIIFQSSKSLVVDEDSNFASCVLTFIIPSDELSQETKIDGFRLYSKGSASSREVYAEVILPEDSNVVISGDTNIKVEWTLIVSFVKDEGE